MDGDIERIKVTKISNMDSLYDDIKNALNRD